MIRQVDFLQKLLMGILCLGFVVACEKEQEQNSTQEEKFLMKAGAVDSNGCYFNFQPDFVFRKDTTPCSGFDDTLGIDLNQDSVIDLQIIWLQKVISIQLPCCPQDSTFECMPYSMNFKWLKTLNNSLQIASTE